MMQQRPSTANIKFKLNFRKFAFLTSSQMRLMLPVQGSHYKNHWCRKIASTRGTLRGNTISNFEGEEKHMPQLGFLIVFFVI